MSAHSGPPASNPPSRKSLPPFEALRAFDAVARLGGVRELHIGHAIVSRAVFVGMREAVREMKGLMTLAAGMRR